MPKANHLFAAAGLLVVLLFAGGLVGLLMLRFDAGDIYPPYSSLRSDPLGARAFHDSLARMPGLTVARHFTGPRRLASETTTLIVAGLGPEAFVHAESDLAALQRFVLGGGRAVLLLTAVKPRRRTDGDPVSDDGTTEEDAALEDEDKETDTPVPRTIDLRSKWGFKLEPPPSPTVRMEAQREASSNRNLPSTIVWHSGMALAAEHPDWKVLYRVDGWPVIMERQLGRGSIFLGTDSYLISNEALRNHPQPALLSHMVGSNRKVVFDETHLGIQQRPGVANLIRRYRLHGLMAGLVLVAALYIWRNGRPFPPAPADQHPEGFRLAYHATDRALVGLIDRHVPDDQLLRTCVTAYEETLVRPNAATKAHLGHIKQLAAEGGRDPVSTYQSICRILARRASR